MDHAFEDLINRIGRFQQSVRFVKYWSAKASAGGTSEFPDFDPLDIPDLLSFIYLLEPKDGRLRYRVSGDNVNSLFQKQHTAQFFDDVVPPEAYKVVAPYFFKTLEGQCCIFKGFVILPNKTFMEFERVLVPVTRHERTLLLGCASFSTTATLRRDAPKEPKRGFTFHTLDTRSGALDETWVDIAQVVNQATAR
jgi:hypothetical protein